MIARALCVAMSLLGGAVAAAQDVELPSRESPALFRGSGSSPSIGEGVRRQLRGIVRCYERALTRSGNVPRGTLRFVIERNGRTSKVRFRRAPGEAVDREFEGCVVGVVRRMRFDPMNERVEIGYPLGVHTG
jgi:hypothetical protein